MLYYWGFLIFAIITEVIGTLSMKYGADTTPVFSHSIMYLMLILSYSSLAIAVKRIPLALAYGAWESLGLVFITLFSALLLDESLSFLKIIAIGLIIVGIVLIDHGTEVHKTKTYNKRVIDHA